MENQQRIDDLSRTIDILMSAKMQNAHQKITNMASFENILQPRMVTLKQSVAHMEQMLKSLSYKNVLARGYAIVRDNKEKIITNINGGKPASIEFTDGVLKLS